MSDRDPPLHGFSLAHQNFSNLNNSLNTSFPPSAGSNSTQGNNNPNRTSDVKIPSPSAIQHYPPQHQHQQPQYMHPQNLPISMSTAPENKAAPPQSATPSSNHMIKKSSTPLGKVVDAGQEHTGRWTKEEHEAFLTGLQEYGKEWKKVAAKVRTRTVVQTRTHAQKYFQKLQKGATGDKIELDLSLIESKKHSSAKQKRSTRQRQQQRQQQQQQPQAENLKQHMNQRGQNTMAGLSKTTQKRQAAIAMSNQAAAQLMAMSQVKPPNNSSLHAPKPPAPSSTFFTSHQSILPPQQFSRKTPSQTFQQMHNPSQSLPFQQPPPHIQSGLIGATNFDSFTVPPISQQMKIIPPNPAQSRKNHMFPEPSPAACGSRKVIELAAAKMLAAVGNNEMNIILKPSQPDEFSARATPPPPNVPDQNSEKHDEKSINPSSIAGIKRQCIDVMPGRLQIVNPDVLGVNNDNSNQNKRINTGQEPTTPWDGQLEALGSEVKNKEKDSNGPTSDMALADTAEDAIEAQLDYHPLHQSTTCNRSSIHLAVCGGSLQEVKRLINMSHTGMNTGTMTSSTKRKLLNEMDNDGFCPMHTAVSLSPSNMAVVMTHLLLSFGADATIVDGFGNTPLHWAARAGNDEVAQVLVLKNCHPNVQNDQGETALHWAMRAGKLGHSVVRVLLENGARASLFNNKFQRAIDVAADGFDAVRLNDHIAESTNDQESIEDTEEICEKIEEKRQSRMNLFCFSPQSRTLVLHHPECLEHVPKSETDWEAPDRVNSIVNSIESNVREYEVQISTDFDKGSLELLSRVHSAEYLTFVNDLSKELEKRELEQIGKENSTMKPTNSVVPFTPMVQRTMGKATDVKKGSHSDTSFSSGSLKAARRAAGAVQHAVDCVLVGRNRNAFCVVRPPGHHAGIDGLLAGGESCGFCIFNNVAAGAMHALSDEGQSPKCERCAIVDIDAHHGNGTEEIVKKCDDPGRLFFFSVHLYDNDKRKGKQNAYKYYPGTGEEDDVAHNIVNVPIVPMWREKEISQLINKPTQSSYGEGRNTRNKAKLKAAADLAVKDDNSNNFETNEEKSANDTAVNKETSTRRTPRCAPPHYYQGSGREAYRRAIQQRLLPALRAFNPDLILISMGFDAAKGDVGNARHYAGGKETEGINLEPEDYAWTTSKILEVADICCQGRVVSVLEGGYGRSPPSNGNELTSRKETESGNMLDKTIFAECAIRHLRAMIDPFDEERLH